MKSSIYTQKEDIECAKTRLNIFKGKLPERIKNELLLQKLRSEQHSLFFTLLNSKHYNLLKNSLQEIDNYSNSKFFGKAVKKLYADRDWMNHKANVREVIVFSYYCNKFKDDTGMKLIWERQIKNIQGQDRNVDISLICQNKTPINIEITGLHQDDEIRSYFDLRYKTRVAIQKHIEKYPVQKYGYQFSLQDSFSEKHIKSFVNFIQTSRNKGVDEYSFNINGDNLATVQISQLNRLNYEYAHSLDVCTRWLNDEKRICNKIAEKAEKQLPLNDINIICVPDLSSDLDDIDYQEAFLGKEAWHINTSSNPPSIAGMSRLDNGAVTIIERKKYAPVYALIYFQWDYSKKQKILNPNLTIDDKIMGLID